jgi:hypothetical membrane protein
MWREYKRTAPFIQSTIFIVTVGVYLTLHHLILVAALFFVAMQASAVVGAMWAYRLKGKLGGASLDHSSLNERMR